MNNEIGKFKTNTPGDKDKKKMAEEYDALLSATGRPGMDSLLKWLREETDFYTAPASIKGHANFEGGLLTHSINVYMILKNFNKHIGIKREDSITIAALLHDVCKTNFYVKTLKNVKTPGKHEWKEKEVYEVDDALPIGHGEKSVYLIMKHIQLTDEEALAIRWHMGGYDDAAREYNGGRAQAKAFNNYPLAPALAIADMYATYFAD